MTEAALARELLVFEGARQIADEDCVIAGTGLPLLAALVAQRTHAPNARLIIESGVVFPKVQPTPMSVVDPRIMDSPSRRGSLVEVLGGFVQRGLVDTGFLGGAQIDEFANINSSWVKREGTGEWIRLPGSGGANDIASHCKNVVVLTTHEPRRFPKRCDYVTSPGFLDGAGGRARAGLGSLEVKIITDLGVLEGNDRDGALSLTKVMPGVSAETVLDNTGFQPRVADDLEVVASPTTEELKLLREELDPHDRYFPERSSSHGKASST